MSYCETCGGDGYLDVTDWSRVHGRSEEEPTMAVTCEECGGSGLVEDVSELGEVA